MFILGLTGSIGMGKTTTANMFRRLRVPVHDADVTVHRLMAKNGAAVTDIETAFPGVIKDGAVDRTLLGAAVFGDEAALARLEAILHPQVRAVQTEFLRRASRRRADVVLLDVPLLYETHGEKNCDAVVVVTASAWLQRLRVLARPGMTQERLQSILARQTPDAEKRRRADFLVQTGLGRAFSFNQVRGIVDFARSCPPGYWPPF
ncbi:MAG: dephospho-CoA kinase [Proteobacteria bacterium]|nr:dephospho-CoA kinase [Pseudomonadota bacterium]